MTRLSHRSILFFMIILALSTILFTTVSPRARAQATMTVGVYSETYGSANITDPSLIPGSTFNLDIQIANIPPINSTGGGINAYKLLVNYNPSILNATDADFKAPLCPASDNCLFATNYFGLGNLVNEPPGNTTVPVVLLGGAVSGSGILFRIHFKVQGVGYTDITVAPTTPDEGIFVAHALTPIPYDPLNGSFDNRPPFSLSANPIIGTVPAGLSISTNVTVNLGVGAPDNVSLSIVGPLPSGMSYTLTRLNGIYPFSSILKLTTTTATSPGSYQVKVNGTCAACSPLGTAFTQILIFPVTVNIVDIGILSVTPSPTQVVTGSQVSFAVSVKNKGTASSTFDVDIMANSTIVASQLGVTLPASGTRTLSIPWNTTTSSPGLYNILAQVPPLRGEFNLADNTMSGGTVRVQAGFSLSLNQTIGTVVQGESITIKVATTLSAIAGEQVTFSVIGLPQGVTAAFTPPSGVPTFTSNLSLTADSSASPGSFQLQVSGTSSSSLGRTATFNLSVRSAHDIGITAVTTATSVVNLNDTVTISVTVTNEGASPETFAVTAFAIDSSGGSHAIGSTQVSILPPGMNQQVTISWLIHGLSPGNYTIHAQVPVLTGEIHVSDNTMTGNSVRLNSPPTSSFTLSTATPTVGDQVSFDASTSADPDGTVMAYSWNFGDGTATRTGKTTTHNYQSTGTYTVTLTVTDNDGATRTSTQTVTVAQSRNEVGSFVTSPAGLSIIAIVIAALVVGMLLLRRRGRSLKGSPSKPTGS